MTAPTVKGALSTYAAEIECDEPDTRHWMHRWCFDENGGQLAMEPPILKGTDLLLTIPNVMRKAAEKHKDRKCMGIRAIEECLIEGQKQFWRKGGYTWRTYGDVFADIDSASKGLFSLAGIADKRKQKQKVVAAMLAETSQEWMISAQAALACGITITTVYSTLGHDAMLHGIQQTEAEIIFMDWGLFEALKDKVLAQCPALRHIVFIGKDLVPLKTTGGPGMPPFGSDLPTIGKAVCTTLDKVIELGKADGAPSSDDLNAVAPVAEDVAIIMYTSGSTGMPKGVVLTHVNFISFVSGIHAQGCILARPDDVTIAYLPLAHILELLVETTCLTQGASIGYGHPRTLAPTSPYIKSEKGEALPGFEADLISLRPTMMAAVPAILDGIAAGIKKKIADTGGTNSQKYLYS
jgi:long-chain acyl-CoA synthetase